MSLEGGNAMKRKLQRVASDQGMRKQARGALKVVGDAKLEEIKPGVPVKHGRLLRSGRVKVMVSSKKEDLRISILFGGQGILYAFKVHETHKTKSKFMERVLLAAVRTIGSELAEQIDLQQAVGS